MATKNKIEHIRIQLFGADYLILTVLVLPFFIVNQFDVNRGFMFQQERKIITMSINSSLTNLSSTYRPHYNTHIVLNYCVSTTYK